MNNFKFACALHNFIAYFSEINIKRFKVYFDIYVLKIMNKLDLNYINFEIKYAILRYKANVTLQRVKTRGAMFEFKYILRRSHVFKVLK